MRHARVPASVYMEDWATAGASQAKAVAHMRTIKDLLEPCGILFNPSKDIIAMSLSFELTKATVLLDILRAHTQLVRAGFGIASSRRLAPASCSTPPGGSAFKFSGRPRSTRHNSSC